MSKFGRPIGKGNRPANYPNQHLNRQGPTPQRPPLRPTLSYTPANRTCLKDLPQQHLPAAPLRKLRELWGKYEKESITPPPNPPKPHEKGPDQQPGIKKLEYATAKPPRPLTNTQPRTGTHTSNIHKANTEQHILAKSYDRRKLLLGSRKTPML